MKQWQKEVDDYGIDAFEMSLTALAQGWDYPPLRKVLQGEINELGWTLAQTLREQGELEQALRIAVKGLSLGSYDHDRLAVWASELAEGINPEIALQTRLKAFQLQPSLPGYLKLKELAGDR